MDLPTHLIVSAAQRAASDAGAGFYIRHKGEAGRGTILLVLNDRQGENRHSENRQGKNRLYRQIWDGTQRRLELLQTGSESAIDASVERERDFDPDLWVIEIEDRQGRLFFDTIFNAAVHSEATI